MPLPEVLRPGAMSKARATWPAGAAGWPRLARAWGSLALKAASGAPAGRGLSRPVLDTGSACGRWESDPGWARLTFDWLNASRVAPHAGNRLYNLGEPGGSLIPSLATCPATYLAGMAPDIVLFDLYTSKERGLERVVRLLMARSPPPLLVSVEFFPALIHRLTAEPSPSWGACGWNMRESPAEIAHENATSYLRYLMEGPPGLSSIEAALDALDQLPAPLMALVPRNSALAIFGGKQRFARDLWRHYGQPVARVVGAYGAAWERREHGLHVCNYSQRSDGLHPASPSSHRLISDLIIAKIKRGLAAAAVAAAAADSAVSGGGGGGGALGGGLPPPRQAEPQTVGLACFDFDKLGYNLARQVPVGQPASLATPPAIEPSHLELLRPGVAPGRPTSTRRAQAMAQAAERRKDAAALQAYGNRGGHTSVVATGVPPRIALSDGWEFVELELNSSTKYKPGIHSMRVGAQLVLELDAESVTSAISAAAAAGDSVELVLQYLQSYRANMGKVRLSCGGGCACDASVVDARCQACTSSIQHSHVVALQPAAAAADAGGGFAAAEAPLETAVTQDGSTARHHSRSACRISPARCARGPPHKSSAPGGDEGRSGGDTLPVPPVPRPSLIPCFVNLTTIAGTGGLEGYRFKISRMLLQRTSREGNPPIRLEERKPPSYK